jgi:PEP-CTERM motif
MNKFTNKKLLAGIVMTGALLASGTASATLCDTLATTDAWAAAGSCTDNEGDMSFTFGSYSGNFPGTTGFDVTEFQSGGIDFYDTGLNWHAASGFPAGYSGGGDIHYTVTSLLAGHNIGGVNFDTIIQGGATTATKQIYDSAGNLLLTLTSTNGSHDPASGGETPFGPMSSFGVTDTFDPTTGARFFNASNSYTVPEPGSMLLLGVGLMGLLYGRRKLGA